MPAIPNITEKGPKKSYCQKEKSTLARVKTSRKALIVLVW
jgi:hypothetical protein